MTGVLVVATLAVVGCVRGPLEGEAADLAPPDAAAPDTAILDAARPDATPCPGSPVAPPGSPASPPPFDAPRTLPLMPGARVLAAADVNRDGRIDLVAPDRLTVLPGVKGGFGAPVGSWTVAAAYDGALADLDGDGKIDVVTAEIEVNAVPFRYTIVSYRGRGDGTFAVGFGLGLSSGARDLRIADLDGDGRRDVAWRDERGALGAGLGNGDGSFRSPPGAPPKDEVTSFALADLDGDRRADLIASTGGRIGVHLGRGDGSFGAPTYYGTAPPWPYGAGVQAVADLDGDAKVDLVAASGDALSIRAGRGDGTFGAERPIASRVVPGEVAAGDFDGDRTPDLVVTEWRGAEVAFLRGLGGLAFAPPALRVAGDFPRSPAIADLDADGRADVALLGALGIALLPGAPGAAPPTTRAEPTVPNARDLAVGDFDRDGRLDVAVVTDGAIDPRGQRQGNGIFLQRGRGDGTFDPPRAISPVVGVALISVDLDRDGAIDLVAVELGSGGVPIAPGKVWPLRGRGDGTFAAVPPVQVATGVDRIVQADLDGDGQVDLAVAGRSAPGVDILRGRGGGAFTRTSLAIAEPAWALALADLDGDGALDVATGRGGYHRFAGSVGLLRGDGRGAFAAEEILSDEVNTLALAAADTDGDGRAELFVGHNAARDGFGQVGVAIVRAGCGAAWSVDPVATLPRAPWSIALADLDGDGRRDVVASQPGVPCFDRCTTFGVAALRARATFAFGPPARYPTGVEPGPIATGDADGDGRTDVIVLDHDSFTVLRNRAP